VDPEAFRSWLERYFAAWGSNDPDDVAALFAEDAEYSWGPFREPARGRDEIVRAWVEGGAPSRIRWSVDPIATSGDRGVAHWTVSFPSDEGTTVELDGILVCSFDDDDRCTLHREWYERRETPAAAGPTT
jgi:ketosteroid isomerase-like protein